jgi:hypothetical protein
MQAAHKHYLHGQTSKEHESAYSAEHAKPREMPFAAFVAAGSPRLRCRNASEVSPPRRRDERQRAGSSTLGD